jgi:GTP-binding protein Era
MERYRVLRPIVLDQKPSPSGVYRRPSEEEEKFFNPKRAPSLSSYVRCPVPPGARVFSQTEIVVQPPNPRRLRVALIGAPNAGKTSLLNCLLGKPIGAVSAKVNTTRESIVGVFTEENCQIEFVDCPGIVPRDGSQEAKELSAEAWMSFNDCDLAVLVVDTAKRPSEEFLATVRKISPRTDIVQELTEHIEGTPFPLNERKEVVLVLNKTDLVEDRKWLKVRNMQLSNQGQFGSCFYVSAKESLNVKNLTKYLKEKCVPGNWRFSPETSTTLSMTGQLEQLIRGALFTWFHKDVPYKIQQQTVGWTERLDGTLIVEHELIVKDSVVARMIIGTKARVLQKLRENVEFKLRKLWGIDKVVLLIHVKAREQRESKRDIIERSKQQDFSSFTSRGSGLTSA